MEVGVYVEGPWLLADLVIGLVLASIRNGVVGSIWPAPLTSFTLASASDPKPAWIGSELVLSPRTCTCEVFSADSKENTTPFFGVNLNLSTSDFPNPCGLGLVLRLL